MGGMWRSAFGLGLGLGRAALASLPALAGCAAGPEARFADVARRSEDPFADRSAAASVLLFLRTDCPISNRYGPEIGRIHAEFRPRGVRFWMVYPDPGDDPARVRSHVEEYALPGRVLLDPEHALVARCGVGTTPEAAVLDAAGVCAYRGRIDDRYVDYGRARFHVTRRDLCAAIESVLAGKPVEHPHLPAVGCPIARR